VQNKEFRVHNKFTFPTLYVKIAGILDYLTKITLLPPSLLGFTSTYFVLNYVVVQAELARNSGRITVQFSMNYNILKLNTLQEQKPAGQTFPQKSFAKQPKCCNFACRQQSKN
jgi:hypothetical protein